jgi:hypothetical protein
LTRQILVDPTDSRQDSPFVHWRPVDRIGRQMRAVMSHGEWTAVEDLIKPFKKTGRWCKIIESVVIDRFCGDRRQA